MVLEQQPTLPLAKVFPPKDGTPYPVKTGDDWSSLASNIGVTTWELIEFNFPVVKSAADFQTKCQWVNWLLREHVGCTKSRDGKNYSFDTSDSPGIIYGPQPTGVLGDLVRTRSALLEALGVGNSLRTVVFALEWHQLSTDTKEKVNIFGHQYDAIADAVYDGRIKVEIHPGLSVAALYLPKIPTASQVSKLGLSGPVPSNTFAVSRPLTSSLRDRALIIHEATHAVCDRMARPMNALFSEIVAFVAEAMYIHKKTGAAKSSSKVHQLSHEVATRVLKGEDPGNDLMSDLSVNIRSDPSYGEFTYGTVPYNGIS